MAINIDRIKSDDPSKTKKYTKWILKQLHDNPHEENLYTRVLDVVMEFDRVGSNFDTPDIYQWGFLGLEASLQARTSNKKERDKIKAHKVFKSERYELIRVDNWEAAIYYGKSTKWCISTEKYSAYEDNTAAGNIYYFLIDKDPSKNMTPEGRVCFEFDWNYVNDLKSCNFPKHQIIQRLRQQCTTYNSRDSIVRYQIQTVNEKISGNKVISHIEKGFSSKYRFLGQFLETAILDLIKLGEHPNLPFKIINRYNKDKLYVKLDNVLDGLDTLDEKIEGIYILLCQEQLRWPIMREIMKSGYLIQALEKFNADRIINYLERPSVLYSLLNNIPNGASTLHKIIDLLERKYNADE